MLKEAKERAKQESAVAKNPFVDLRERINRFWHETFERHLGGGPTSCIPSSQVRKMMNAIAPKLEKFY